MIWLLIYIIICASHETQQCVPLQSVANPANSDSRPNNIVQPNVRPNIMASGYDNSPLVLPGYNALPYILVPVGLSPNTWPWLPGTPSPTCPCNLSTTTQVS